MAAAADLTPITPNPTSYYWVTGIDVQNTTARGTIVAFGDSITDGFNSTIDGSKRYPNDLSSRVLANAGSAGYSVVNAGISGNRILHDVFGPMATGRFDRDALLSTGASHVIVTSWVFRDGQLDWPRLKSLVQLISKERLVLDLSCRQRDGKYFVVTDRWQKFTNLSLSPDTLHELAKSCEEFLIHAVDVEGLCRGVDLELVEKLGDWASIPTTYAGGARSMKDLEEVHQIGKGRIDLTIGSALDIFGGTGVRYADVVEFNRKAINRFAK